MGASAGRRCSTLKGPPSRLSPVATYRLTSDLYVEAALPQLSIVTGHGGVVSLGASVRAGSSASTASKLSTAS